MQPYTLLDLVNPLQKLTKDVALYLPRTSDMRQLADSTKSKMNTTTVMHYCMEGASKVRILVSASVVLALMIPRRSVCIMGPSNFIERAIIRSGVFDAGSACLMRSTTLELSHP